MFARRGRGFVDDEKNVSEKVVSTVILKAFPLDISFSVPSSIIERLSQVQVGLLRKLRFAVSTGGSPHYSVTPVTAKHNLRSYFNENGENARPEARSAKLFLKNDQGRTKMAFRDLNWDDSPASSCAVRLREDVNWPFGVDISVGDSIEYFANGVTNESVT